MKLILNILLIVLFVSTIAICTVKPSMHKSVMVYDSAYKIVPEKQIEVEEQKIPIMEKTTEPVKVVKSAETQIKTEPKTIRTSSPVKVSVQTTNQKQAVTSQNQKQQTPISVTKISVTTPKVSVTVEPTVKVVEQKPVTQKQTNTAPKVMTEQEEKIAWNVWRSNLQNQIMHDVKLPYIPKGTIFRFSFSVDKYGKVSNVQTWSETPTYTPYAIQYIAPVIRGYQGRSILNFPTGTARITTDVTGGWKISENEKYSKPQDFHDIETIRK